MSRAIELCNQYLYIYILFSGLLQGMLEEKIKQLQMEKEEYIKKEVIEPSWISITYLLK